MQRNTTFLGFEKEAWEAARFSTPIFKDPKIKDTTRGIGGQVLKYKELPFQDAFTNLSINKIKRSLSIRVRGGLCPEYY
jgi:predicted 3-demethylubiquinone-9 3-methyltransferase (glyoxalase superfamily)